MLTNTPIGNNGIGNLLNEADEGAWLTGEILAPLPIPAKYLSFLNNQSLKTLSTQVINIGDKVVDNVVKTTKSVKGAGKSIYQTRLERGYKSPELGTPDGQTIKVGDVEFENQLIKVSTEYFDENGMNEVTGNRAVDSKHLEDYNRGLEEAIETEKIGIADELSPELS